MTAHGAESVNEMVLKALNSYTKGNDILTKQMGAREYLMEKLKKHSWDHKK